MAILTDDATHDTLPALPPTPSTIPPANDVEDEAPPSDVIAAGGAQYTLSRALDRLVAALANLAMPEAKRREVAAAYLRVERVSMGCARALDDA